MIDINDDMIFYAASGTQFYITGGIKINTMKRNLSHTRGIDISDINGNDKELYIRIGTHQ